MLQILSPLAKKDNLNLPTNAFACGKIGPS